MLAPLSEKPKSSLSEPSTSAPVMVPVLMSNEWALSTVLSVSAGGFAFSSGLSVPVSISARAQAITIHAAFLHPAESAPVSVASLLPLMVKLTVWCCTRPVCLQTTTSALMEMESRVIHLLARRWRAVVQPEFIRASALVGHDKSCCRSCHRQALWPTTHTTCRWEPHTWSQPVRYRRQNRR